MILAGYLVFSPIYRISFQVDLVSVLICLTIAVFGTAFTFFLSMKAVVTRFSAGCIGGGEKLSSTLLVFFFLDWTWMVFWP